MRACRSFNSSSTRRRWSPSDSSSICRAPSLADSSAFTCSRRAKSPDADSSSLRDRADIALHRRQILVDLRQLIPQRGGFAQQPQHLLPRALRSPRSRSRRSFCRPSRSASCPATAPAPRRSRLPAAPALARALPAPPARAAAATSRSCVSVSPAASRSSMEPICLACNSSRPRVRSDSRFSSATRPRAAVSAASVR